MSKGYDDMLNVPANQENNRKVFVEESKKNRAKCYELAEQMLGEIKADGSRFQRYLDVQSQFERYTPNNVLLIMAQKADAKRLGDYNYWKEQGVSVKRTEYDSPILILEPGKEYQREDGRKGTYYNAKKIYDISQTTMKEPVEKQESMDERILVRALVNHPPVSIVSKEPDSMPDGQAAFFSPKDGCIYVKKGMDVNAIFKNLIPELVYAERADGDKNYDCREDAFHAKCVSYMLCRKYGIDTKDFDFQQAPEFFKNKEPREMKKELSRIKDSMGNISSRMAKVLETTKEKQYSSSERGTR